MSEKALITSDQFRFRSLSNSFSLFSTTPSRKKIQSFEIVIPTVQDAHLVSRIARNSPLLRFRKSVAKFSSENSVKVFRSNTCTRLESTSNPYHPSSTAKYVNQLEPCDLTEKFHFQSLPVFTLLLTPHQHAPVYEIQFQTAVYRERLIFSLVFFRHPPPVHGRRGQCASCLSGKLGLYCVERKFKDVLETHPIRCTHSVRTDRRDEFSKE